MRISNRFALISFFVLSACIDTKNNMSKTGQSSLTPGGGGVSPTGVNLVLPDLAAGFGTNGVATAQSLDSASNVFASRGMSVIEARADLLFVAGFQMNGSSLKSLRIWPVDARPSTAGKAATQYLNSGQSFLLPTSGCHLLSQRLTTLPASLSTLPLAGSMDWDITVPPRMMVLNGWVWVVSQVTLSGTHPSILIQRVRLSDRNYDASTACLVISNVGDLVGDATTADSLSPVGLLNVSSNNRLSAALAIHRKVNGSRSDIGIFHLDAQNFDVINQFWDDSVFPSLEANLIDSNHVEFFGVDSNGISLKRYSINALSVYTDESWAGMKVDPALPIPSSFSISAAVMGPDKSWIWSGVSSTTAAVGRVVSHSNRDQVRVDGDFGMAGYVPFTNFSVSKVGAPSVSVNGILVPVMANQSNAQGFGRVLRADMQGSVMSSWGYLGSRNSGSVSDSDLTSVFWWGGSRILAVGGRSSGTNTRMYLSEMLGN